MAELAKRDIAKAAETTFQFCLCVFCVQGCRRQGLSAFVSITIAKAANTLRHQTATCK